MSWFDRFYTKHRVFISYYHKDDEYYRILFEMLFGHLFINKSVKLGDISNDVSTDYIKRLIQEDYITGSSVVLVLIGPKTWGRKHVDWEISAGLNIKVGGYSGLLGILLPTFELTPDGKYSYEAIPKRLADNVMGGYANVYRWDEACKNETIVLKVIEEAFQKRVTEYYRIDNSTLQFVNNRCE